MEAGSRQAVDLWIHGAAEVITSVPRGGDPAGRVRDGVVAVAGERIVAVGPAAELETRLDLAGAASLDARGGALAPGFVDAHTHLVYGGSRVREYVARLTRDRAEVEAMGIPTGIAATVAMTRAAPTGELVAAATRRLDELLAHGVTTVESKSGYGLDLEHEVRQLEVNRALDAAHPIDVVGTFLGAHAFPADRSRADYLALLTREMIPEVARRELAEFCDVYCDEGYYTVDEARQVLEAGAAHGLRPKIHTEQYSPSGGARLAAELGAVSADHLNYVDRAQMEALAGAGVVGVLMPLIDFAVDHPRPFRAREMLDAGMRLALATDLCPGGPAASLALAMQFACRRSGLTPAEALLAATAGGAAALARDDRGRLAVGLLADLQVWDVPSLDEAVYRLGHNPVRQVVKRGKVVRG